jgi:Uma2 family endonuclease
MHDVDRLTTDEFFEWHRHVEGRYELVEGRIVPHPDFVLPQGLSAPSNDHGRVVANLTVALGRRLKAPCRVYVGAGVEVDAHNGNVPDLAVSCLETDASGKKLTEPRYIFEVLSPSTRRIDVGRKVGDYLAVRSVAAYVVLDHERRAAIVYRPDSLPQTIAFGTFALDGNLELDIDECCA